MNDAEKRDFLINASYQIHKGKRQRLYDNLPCRGWKQKMIYVMLKMEFRQSVIAGVAGVTQQRVSQYRRKWAFPTSS